VSLKNQSAKKTSKHLRWDALPTTVSVLDVLHPQVLSVWRETELFQQASAQQLVLVVLERGPI